MLTGVEKQLSANELARLYAASGASELAVSRDEFVRWLLAVLQQHATVESLHLQDLVLARACAQGNVAAWDLFLTRYRQKLYSAGAAIARDEASGRELADSLYAELYGTL